MRFMKMDYKTNFAVTAKVSFSVQGFDKPVSCVTSVALEMPHGSDGVQDSKSVSPDTKDAVVTNGDGVKQSVSGAVSKGTEAWGAVGATEPSQSGGSGGRAKEDVILEVGRDVQQGVASLGKKPGGGFSAEFSFTVESSVRDASDRFLPRMKEQVVADISLMRQEVAALRNSVEQKPGVLLSMGDTCERRTGTQGVVETVRGRGGSQDRRVQVERGAERGRNRRSRERDSPRDNAVRKKNDDTGPAQRAVKLSEKKTSVRSGESKSKSKSTSKSSRNK